jgi:hypothetical protein
MKEFDEDQRQRDRIEDDMEDMRKILKKIKESQRVNKGT